MPETYQIHLNFLPVQGEFPDFVVYRQKRTTSKAARPNLADIRAYSLPTQACDIDTRSSYWVSLAEHPGFEEFRVGPTFNHDLTRWVLFLLIRQSTTKHWSAEGFEEPKNPFIEEVRLTMQQHTEGKEQLVVQPYYLRSAAKFGILVDFQFRLAKEAKFDRRIQQLSLSLDKSFHRNLDYYADRLSKITGFTKRAWHVLSPLTFPGTGTSVSLDFTHEPTRADRLRGRVYVFGASREARSQFVGLRDHGPLTPLSHSPHILFIFREQDRQAARRLAMALRGTKQRERFNFPGFEALFKTPIEIDGNPIVIQDFSKASMTSALTRISKHDGVTVPVLVIPDDDDNAYLNHKAVFSHSGVATQVCTLPVIQDENALKWSVANIALQIFCKAGGQPWKVRPTAEPSLIIGISQSHKRHKSVSGVHVEKYFAFSVLTDSSGLFRKIQVLGEGTDEDSYLDALRTELRKTLTSSAAAFSRVVIHTSFKLKHREIDAIRDVTQEVATNPDSTKTRFAVVKVNHRNRFFGVNRGVNSLVPYEGTYVKLGFGEYLVWFEGVFPDKLTVTKAFSGPTHLEFLRLTDDSGIDQSVLLQDLMNLSGANWRGFNAKNAPVSVFYCHLVADLVHDFHEKGLPLPAVEDLRPWFL